MNENSEQPYVIIRHTGIGTVAMSIGAPKKERSARIIGPFKTVAGANACAAYHRCGWGIDSYEKYAELHPNDLNILGRKVAPLYG